MKKAFLVGINSYYNTEPLTACVNDAKAVSELLEKNSDGSRNYDCRIWLDKTDNGETITRKLFRKACEELFADHDGEILLYFSGHGVLGSTGGFLCTTDSEKHDLGIPMQEIVELASCSKASDILILLDCCHSGDFANPRLLNSGHNPLSALRENLTVIASSRPNQEAKEAGGHGFFTSALLDALDGGAADHIGWVTAPSIYAYIERRFGSWGSRPVYKSYATRVGIIRQCAPLIDRLKLEQLIQIFQTINYKFPLDPEYEPEDENGVYHEPVNKAKVELAQLFKEYRDAGLLKPSTQNEQLFWTARRSHTIELTPRGREYWSLVKMKKL